MGRHMASTGNQVPEKKEEQITESLEVRAKLLTFKGAELDTSSSSYPSYLGGLRVEIS